MNRRTFIHIAGLAGLGSLAAPHLPARAAVVKHSRMGSDPVSLLRDLVEEALDAGASYADARFVSQRSQSIQVRRESVYSLAGNETAGVGLRVYHKGNWGFSASNDQLDIDPSAMARTACAMAAATALVQHIPFSKDGRLDDRSVEWKSPCAVDPFTVPLAEKIEFLASILQPAVKNRGIAYAVANLFQVKKHSLFVSSLDAVIEQTFVTTHPNFAVTAFDQSNGRIDSRASALEPRLIGWEVARADTFETEVWKAADEALEMQKAYAVAPGSYDIILAPSHFRRVLLDTLLPQLDPLSVTGMDGDNPSLNMFTPSDIGGTRVASTLLDLGYDTTMPNGLASCGWDDSGRPASRGDIVHHGTLAALPGSDELLGAPVAWKGSVSRAAGWQAPPRFAMPNVTVAAGTAGSTDDLIAGTDRGLLIEGRGAVTHSINRRLFRTGGQRTWLIEKGKKGPMLRDTEYEASIESFWSSLAALGGPESLETGGELFPQNAHAMWEMPFSIQAPAARFSAVSVVPRQEVQR